MVPAQPADETALYSTETAGSIKYGASALDAAVKDAVQRINDINK